MSPMKNMSIKFIKLLLTAVISVFCSSFVMAQIGIGVPAGEVPSATLDIRFDSALSPGFLMPRVTALPTGDIAEGMLIIYCPGCTDTDGDGQINYETGTYYVYVDSDGNGTLEWTPLTSNAGVVEVDDEAPSSPSNLVASNPTSSTIDLSWTASTDNVAVSGYFIYFSDGTLATTAPSNSITVNSLNPSTSYTFYVTAYDAAMNESGQSNNATQVTTGIPDTEVPTTPTNLVASNITTSTIDLSWSASTDNVGVAGYYVYQDGVQVSDVTSGTSTTISGLTESTQYSFYVRAYDAAGNLSGQSNTVTPMTDSPCVASTICETSFESSYDCWTAFTYTGGASIVRTNNPGCSFQAYQGTKVVKVQYAGGLELLNNDFTGKTSIDISFWHTGYYAQNSNSCSRIESNDINIQVSTNGISWTTVDSFTSDGSWQNASTTIDGSYMTANISIRILCIGSSNKNYILLDSTRIDVNCD